MVHELSSTDILVQELPSTNTLVHATFQSRTPNTLPVDPEFTH